jgi:hypothetical protein
MANDTFMYKFPGSEEWKLSPYSTAHETALL